MPRARCVDRDQGAWSRDEQVLPSSPRTVCRRPLPVNRHGTGTEGRDGKELFYFAGQTLIAVPVSLGPTFSYGSAAKLFDAPMPSGYTNAGDLWQVAPDGKRFLFLPMAGSQQAPPLEVVVNWPALLRQKGE